MHVHTVFGQIESMSGESIANSQLLVSAAPLQREPRGAGGGRGRERGLSEEKGKKAHERARVFTRQPSNLGAVQQMCLE